MKKKFENVYQFKIALKGIKPLIWRRIQVPENYSFWDFHVAVQDAMGWTDTHLHHFDIVNPAHSRREEIGLPDEEGILDHEVLAGWKQKIAEYFTLNNDKANYIYDYGDNWEHTIKLEKILPREKGIKYPICIEGARACPPEDCGGKWGYEELLEAIMDPNHKRHEELSDWVEGDFDPEYFDIDNIVFDDPKKRLENVLIV